MSGQWHDSSWGLGGNISEGPVSDKDEDETPVHCTECGVAVRRANRKLKLCERHKPSKDTHSFKGRRERVATRQAKDEDTPPESEEEEE